MTRKQPQQEQPRLYARFDSIAEARRGSRLQVLRRELDSAERGSACAFSLFGMPADPVQRQGQMDAIESKRQEIARVEALTGDALCVEFAADAIAFEQAPPRITLEDTLLRGAMVGVGVPPGMGG